MHHPTTRFVVPTTMLTVAVGLLAACGSGSGSGSGGAPPEQEAPSAGVSTPYPAMSESADPQVQLEQEQVEAAQAALVEYYEASDDVANDGYRDWQHLRGYMGPQAWKSESSLLELNESDGGRTSGRVEIVSMTVDEYVEDPTGSEFEQVSIDLCSDVSGVTTYDGDGDEVPRAARLSERFVTNYLMQHQGTDGAWLIAEREPLVERAC